MASRTVSLEESAYDRLRHAKRPGESFTETVNRLLEGSKPSFSRLAGALSEEDARRIRDATGRMRALELTAERTRHPQARRSRRGRNPGQ